MASLTLPRTSLNLWSLFERVRKLIFFVSGKVSNALRFERLIKIALVCLLDISDERFFPVTLFASLGGRIFCSRFIHIKNEKKVMTVIMVIKRPQHDTQIEA